MLSPTIWEDPSFNKLSVGGRLLFIGLISNADDFGYLRGDKGSIRRTIFGFDDVTPDLQSWIDEVAAMKNVHFYVVADETYVHLLKWDKYQKQQKDRKQPSEYPMCSKCKAND